MRRAVGAGSVGAVLVGLALVSTTSHGGGSAAQGRAEERVDGGVVARLPFVGTLTWRCDRTGRSARFSTRLTLPDPGATVFVSVSSDGAPVVRGKQIDPPDPPRRGGAGPFAARRSQAWTIRYDHKDATLTVRARLRFAVPTGDGHGCVLSRSTIDTRRDVR